MDQTEANRNGFPSVSFDEFSAPAQEEWRAAAVTALKGAPFDKRMYTKTYEGITLDPIYTLEGTKELLRESDLPGYTDYLRGVRASGYIAEPWTVAQSCSAVLPEEANKILLRELEKGGGAVNIELDACSLAAKDPDGAAFKGDYRGVSIATLKDLRTALEGIDPSKTPLNIFAGASALPMAALAAAHGGDKAKDYKGCIGADPLGVLASEGSLPLPLGKYLDEMASVIEWAEDNMPQVKTILIRGEAYHNGGASATQETAYAVSAAIAYLRAMRERGVALETALRHIRFSFAIGANFFMEIARLRAARVVWAQVASAFGADPEEYGRMDVIAGTSRFTGTVYDPYVNILRATSQAFSAAVGGVGAMDVACFDSAVRPSGELSRRVARNIQIMLQTEFDICQPVDPAGGSWYVESLTAKAAQEIWKLIQETDAAGGLYAALKSGAVQDAVESVLESRFRNLAFRSDRAVGTNMYPNTLEQPLENNAAKAEELFAARKAAVAGGRAAKELASIKCPSCVVRAFAAGATLSEVRAALSKGAAGGEEVRAIGVHRWTERIEALRKRTEDGAARTGKNIRVFLANMGPVPQHKARADFSTGFMEVAHFEVLGNNGFATPEEAVKAAVESGADAAVICSKDETYPELVPPVAKGIKAARPDMKVFLAGAPAPEFKDAYTEAGVDGFIHVKANCYDILKSIQDSKEGF